MARSCSAIVDHHAVQSAKACLLPGFGEINHRNERARREAIRVQERLLDAGMGHRRHHEVGGRPARRLESSWACSPEAHVACHGQQPVAIGCPASDRAHFLQREDLGERLQMAARLQAAGDKADHLGIPCAPCDGRAVAESPAVRTPVIQSPSMMHLGAHRWRHRTP